MSTTSTETPADVRNRQAIAPLVDLLSALNERPGAWEAIHVEAIEDRLGQVVDVLMGAAEMEVRP